MGRTIAPIEGLFAARGFGLAAALLCAWLALAGAAQAQELRFMEYARVDPAKIVTAEACGECHASAFEVWEDTPHATTFKTMHLKERAETIAGKLGFGLIKRDSFCFSCHYTPVVKSGKIRVVSGVSCESCHGAGANWIEVHNDYGPGQTHETESAEHRRERIEHSRRLGMRRPSDLYEVAANCFSCHSVPNEQLVNDGGHSTGSVGFELVEWSQGEIRHNFLDSFREGQVGPNVQRSSERRRVMYVAGRALDLEYSMRGAAVATGAGIYAKAMSRRVSSALAEVKAIQASADIPEIGRMLAAVKGVRVGPGNEPALLAAADAVGRQTQSFLGRADRALGTQLAALDPLLAGTAPVFDPEPVEPAGTLLAASPPDGTPAGSPGTTTTETTPTTLAVGRQIATGDGSGVTGQIKRRIRPASSHRTLGSNACSGCHEAQNEWWFGHEHYLSADPFFDGASKNVQIARLYGVDPAEMTTGRHVCMDCHGTVVSGKESRDVLDGVSCESCHGAAADWLEPHKDEAGKELGVNRPGYVAALKLGKQELGDLETRTTVCAGCHYITEARLLSAGHPSGADFDYVAGMRSVRHWQPAVPEARLASAFAARLAARGAVPKVRVAKLDPAPSAPAGGSAKPRTLGRGPVPGTVQAEARGQRAVERRRAAGLEPPAPRPAFAVELAEAVRFDLDLPPFPQIDASTSIEDVLLLLRERLRLLYRSVAPTEDGR